MPAPIENESEISQDALPANADSLDEVHREAGSKFILGLCTLLVGVAALGTAIVNAIVFDPKPPGAREPKAAIPIEGKKTVEWRGLKVHWGGKAAKQEPQAEKVELPVSKWAMAGTAVLAVLGLGLGPLAYWRDVGYILISPGMTFCFLAVTWQYVIWGVLIGIAAALCIFLLSRLG